jgi:membrane protein DedA with SNARE-associated domain
MTERIITDLIGFVQTLPWWGVLLITFLNAYVENIFPPSPSDVILVFIGTMVGVGIIDFPSTTIAATLGSTLGFMTMFQIGRRVDRRVVESGKYRFIPVDTVHKVEAWFRRWGYFVIVVNRFLSGTRAVVAFLAGMSKMHYQKSTMLSCVSALVWNSLILFAGMQLGKNWHDIEPIFETYSTAVITMLCLLTALYFLRKYFKARSVS